MLSDQKRQKPGLPPEPAAAIIAVKLGTSGALPNFIEVMISNCSELSLALASS